MNSPGTWNVAVRDDLPPSMLIRAMRFIQKVWVPDPVIYPDACWIWQAAVNGTHRGQFTLYPYQMKDGKRVTCSTTAPRAAYILFVGDLADDECAMHTVCDEPMCVRPSHLRKGTYVENYRDMVAKGRAWYQRRAA